MRRWLSSTSRCGLHVFRWPTYTDIYWRVFRLGISRMDRKRKLDRSSASNFHTEEGRGLYWKTRPLSQLPLRSSPTINPFPLLLSLSPPQIEHDFSFSKISRMKKWNLCFDVCILIFKRDGKRGFESIVRQ